MFSTEDVQQQAAVLGFRPDSLEKVIRMLSLLSALRSHTFLRPRIALKGDTALNLFLFNVPRLSVDIDLNYVGSADRATMLAEKPKTEQAIAAVCAREGLLVKRMPTEHAGGKWRLSYVNTAGSSDKLEIDLNFMLRLPIWPVISMNSRAIGPAVANGVAVLDRHELAAGKLAALCSRKASRDIFDARELLRHTNLDRDKLRLAFVVYGGLNRKDWRTVCVDDIAAEPFEIKRDLLPMLRGEVRPRGNELASWTEALVCETRERLAVVLPLMPHEREFLDRLNDSGEIIPDILTDNPEMQTIIRTHPGLKWKALNVKRHLGIASGDEPIE